MIDILLPNYIAPASKSNTFAFSMMLHIFKSASAAQQIKQIKKWYSKVNTGQFIAISFVKKFFVASVCNWTKLDKFGVSIRDNCIRD